MLNQQMESELLSNVSRGSSKAFRHLYFLWEPTLTSFIFQITKSKELTAEIVQDVFLKIWMTRESLQGVNNFKAYLYVVSKNQAINALKKSIAELEKFKIYTNNPHLFEEETDENKEYHYSLIDEAIEKLPNRQKEVFLLHRHEKLTYQEIAYRLGIGKESVKSHLSASIKSIKSYLQAKISLILLFIEVVSKKID
ncbi:MAG: sigma-70 family RNA polymerase sigma factor [Bacteroidetes bacterium]|nr:sigma-70 family RNA polymerase sigma factor [Bacteroidota bacterium]